ncbi:MAG: aromatic amino acid lyase [Ardenticatenales bacterium]|nr:aromatic amino acid lyase [Ardenticatenales bacterium]
MHDPLDLAAADGHPRQLTTGDVVAVARGLHAVAPLREDPAIQRPIEAAMEASAAWVASIVDRIEDPATPTVYGINTGFGALAGRRTLRSAYEADVLQRNLLVSHAVGGGRLLGEDEVRAAAFVRAGQLARGRSGIRIAVVNRLIALLNGRVLPTVHAMGSLGASGDLAPLAYLALAISAPPEPPTGTTALPVDGFDMPAWVLADDTPGQPWSWSPDDLRIVPDPRDGRPRFWRRVPAAAAMAPFGGQIRLRAKEGLALTNGATLTAALAALAVHDAQRVLEHAVLALAMTLEAARGFRDAFLAPLQAVRGSPGQASAAARVLDLTHGSTLLDPGDDDRDPERVPPQDPYSIRCGPQVIGAARDALDFIGGIVERELNAAVDNPLIFTELRRPTKAVSGGNFHGAPLGYGLDLLKIVVTDVASQSERRTYKLTDYRFDDPGRRAYSLPFFLVPPDSGPEGLNSGLMIPQYVAAAHVSACKTLAHPDSVDSIPSSAGQEDHVAMSLNAALHARMILDHAADVVAIELLTAAQALRLRLAEGVGTPGGPVGRVIERVAMDIGAPGFDRALHVDLSAMRRLVHTGELLAAADEAIDADRRLRGGGAAVNGA